MIQLQGEWYALLLTAGAGLATTLGASLAFCINYHDNRVLAICLGLSAGVMTYVSLVEMLEEAAEQLELKGFGKEDSFSMATGLLFLGLLLTVLLDKGLALTFASRAKPQDKLDVVVEDAEKGEVQAEDGQQHLEKEEHDDMMQMGVFTCAVIALHNFPEGLATFMATMADPQVGPTVALAIAIHNIPEGIAVATPLLRATGSRRKAFLWAFLSGLSEPLGGLAAWLLLRQVAGPLAFAILFGLTAGVMIHISFKKMLPTAMKHDSENKYTAHAFFCGMFIMAVSLVAFQY